MQSLIYKKVISVAVKEVKCFYCKEKDDKDSMLCEENPTGKFNQNGTEKIKRTYFHYNCHVEYKKVQEFKKVEFQQWDKLYQYLLKLHNLEVLDGRMIEKVQDLRNGSIKLNGKKINKYKNGIGYDVIFETYRQQSNNIDWNIKNRNYERKWNEFSYIFGIILGSINDVNEELKRKEKQENQQEVQARESAKDFEDVCDKPAKTKKKKDELDISSFL
jgi:hypothetical protein